jgi:hypothetical protein
MSKDHLQASPIYHLERRFTIVSAALVRTK